MKWEVSEIGSKSLTRVWPNQRNESEKREWEKRNGGQNESLPKFRVPRQFCIAEND